MKEKILELNLRWLIREFAIRGDHPTVLYHGTLRSNVNSILATGLRAGAGWGGAAKPGVFLSSRENLGAPGMSVVITPLPRSGHHLSPIRPI